MYAIAKLLINKDLLSEYHKRKFHFAEAEV